MICFIKQIMYIIINKKTNNMSFVLSEEQENIINCDDSNIIVDSVAGSGKTTTILHYAMEYNNKQFLLLTYNAKLKLESRKKAQILGLHNIEIHSYHSFCVKYYDSNAFRDTPIENIINTDKPNKIKFKYDYIIVDEAQDMTLLYYYLFQKIYRNNVNKQALIIIIGDKNQSIFQFNGADYRFITMAEQCFSLNTYSWNYFNLSNSFRITSPMSNFINNCMMGYQRLTSSKQGILPEYIYCNSFSDIPFKKLLEILVEYEPEDIFVLAPSLRSHKTPVRVLENKIKIQFPEIPVYVPVSDDEQIDDSIIKGKLVFSTYHQVKGLERKVVIVYGFDSSYFQYYKQNVSKFICPNELYVATTRASEHLVLIHDNKSNCLEFIDKTKLRKYVKVNSSKFLLSNRISNNINNNLNKTTSPTDLCRHIPEYIFNKCMKYFYIHKIRNASDIIQISHSTIQNNTIESVSEINGTAIPLYFEYLNKGTIDIINKLPFNKNITNYNKEERFSIDIDLDIKLRNIIESIEQKNLSIEDLLYLTNRWNTFKSGYLFKLNQITDYNWISQEQMTNCYTNIENLNIQHNARFEKELLMAYPFKNMNIKLIGFIDCVDNTNIYEFKCVKELEQQHFIQLAIYALMNELEKEIIRSSKSYNYYLYNILTDEQYEIKFTFDNLILMIEELIDYKYFNNSNISDEEFIQEINNILHNYSQTVIEQTAIEQTVIEQTTDEQTAIEQTVIEQTADEQTADEQTADEQTVIEQTAIEQTADEQTADEQTVIEQTAIEQTVIEQTVIEQTTDEQTAIEQTVIEQTADEQTVIEQTADEQTVIEQTVIEQTADEQTVIEQTAIEQTADELKADELKADELKADEQTAIEQTVIEQTAIEQTADELKADELKADELKADEQTVIEQTVIEQTAIEQTADELKADELKADELKADELKADELKADELKADELKADELKVDELKAGELKADELKADELKADELKADKLKERKCSLIYNFIKPKNNRIMIFDIETDGKQKIIQIGYYIYDNGILEKEEDILIRNVNLDIDFYNRFTLDDIIQNGKYPEVALDIFKRDLDQCSYVCGHNIKSFDCPKLKKYAEKYGFDIQFPIIIDTMRCSKLTQLKDKRGRLKQPKLSELYEYFFEESLDLDIQHTALYDVEITSKCFYKLVEINYDNIQYFL